ncbi:MAG: LamG domain-containing protein [Planctomycetes bacterium]|nr:LamG domain-containing protein [Planctomycetota bacterium]
MGRQIIIVTALVLGLVGSVGAADPDPSLMGYWKLDGDTLDASGHGRAGTLVGNAAFAAGLDGQALTLDGSGDYMRVDSYQGVLGGNPFSIAAWVNTTNTGDRTIVNWGSSTNGQRVDFRLASGRLRVEHGNGNLQGSSTVANGEWHHVAVTVGPNASIQPPDVTLYLDGKNDSQATTDPDKFNITANVPVTIGQRRTNNDRAFLGLIDEVRIYDRVLTADEVQALALHPKAYAPSPADKAQDVGNPLFTWKPRETALWHDVYLGTDPNLGPAQLVAPRSMAALYYHVPGLVPGTTYYWRVDEIEPDGTVYQGEVWTFVYSPKEAWQALPADGEPYTNPDLTLSWKVGLGALSHDVYFGTDQAAVADGTGDTFKGNQMLTTFKTGPLTLDTTYFWRIDEVAPDGTKLKGNVWTFKTLPAIAVTDPNLVGWWTMDEGKGTRAVDWSGHGHHADFAGPAPWTPGYDGTAAGPFGSGQYLEVSGWPGILGKKDRTCAAWIKTTATGDFMGWGLATNTQKWVFRVQTDNGNPGSIRVECQGGRICGWTDVRDGEWHHVAAVLKSSGAPTTLNIGLYVDGMQEPISDSQAVDVNTVSGTRNVRIGDAHQSRPFPGLIDEARIYDKALTQEELQLVMRIDPLRAWGPEPRNGWLADIRTATPLTWTKGDKASKHDVYLGSDAAAVAAAAPSDSTGIYCGRIGTTSFTPAEDLAWGQKYFWRVDEIDADGTITAGKVWTFTVADYLIVDDFETYTDVQGEAIFDTWIDGYTNGLSGSTVGNTTAPFAERTIIYHGAQAMPLDYNNTKSPWYSEAERTFASVENWTFGGMDTLVVHFRGAPVDFLESAGTITLSAAGTDIWNTTDEFRYAFKRLTGDGSIIARVDSITNTNVWAKGGVMIRETLDPGSRQAMVVVTPGSGVAFQRRLTNNDVSVSTAQTGVTAPHWVKLTRAGNLLTAQHSADGVTWSDVVNATSPTSDTVVMGGTIYIGVALTSHAANVACTAVFSNIKTTGNVTGSWQQAEVGVDHPGNSAQSLYVGIEDSAGKVAIVAHPDPAASTVGAWTEWTIPLSSFTGVNPAKVKKMYLGVGDRKNPVADGTGRVYLDDIRVTKGMPQPTP